jgi:DNA-binding winged helix-turn-helix (wHTH) protein
MSGKMPGQIEGLSGERAVSCFGGVTLDAATRQVTRGAIALHLTPKAFDLLAILAHEAPRVVPKAELHERLWPRTFVSDATLVSLVKELRRTLDDRDLARPIIRTAHGVGYALAVAVDRVSSHVRSEVWHWLEVDGRHIRLVEGENVIGRDPACRVWLDVARVSRRHARVVVDADGARLEDLGSKNRTTLGSAAVEDQVQLSDGDQIHVGPIRLVYRRSRSGMSTETQVGAESGR